MIRSQSSASRVSYLWPGTKPGDWVNGWLLILSKRSFGCVWFPSVNPYAMKLLLQKTYPSWLYPISRGATTIWERWDGIKPDSTFQNPEMNSFNHYAYGAIGDWIYTNIAGIRENESYPGYKQFTIKPYITDSLSYAKAHFNSLYGTIVSEWTRDGNQISFRVSVPLNTRAAINIHTSEIESVTECGKSLFEAFEASDCIKSDSGYTIYAGSGDYNFHYLLH